MNKLCDPIGEDEENAVSVTVTTDMGKEDVVRMWTCSVSHEQLLKTN